MSRAAAVAFVCAALAACQASSRAELDAGSGSGFVWRGVIEGYYGPPWEEQDRTDLLAWMAAHRYNVYIHAAKNDPYQRLQWREPYPVEEMQRYAAEIALAQGRGLAWVPSVSPGFPLLEAAQPHDRDICFSCEDDFAVLAAKLDAFWDLGARALMVSFDDVVKISTHAEDAERYGSGGRAYGVMNADLLNRVYQRYAARDPRFVLFTVAADYSGSKGSDYLDGFRETLRPEIEVMWTGTQVYSSAIQCQDASGYGAAIGRKPVLWDNFTNDSAPYKLLVGPYDGRAADLADCLRGIVINPSPQAQADKLALSSVADYLADPADYDPEAAWDRAVSEFAGSPDMRAMLDPFIQNVRSTHMNRTEAVRFEWLYQDFEAALATPDWLVPERALLDELNLEAATPAALRTGFVNPRVVAEFDTVLMLRSAQRTATDSWLDQLAFNAGRALDATQALARLRPALDAARDGAQVCGEAQPPATAPELLLSTARITAALPGYTGSELPTVNVHGDRFFFALGPVWYLENRVDRYLREALQKLGAAAPQASLAASTVSLTANEAPVALDAEGRFCLESAVQTELLATDGAGGQTRLIVSAMNPGA